MVKAIRAGYEFNLFEDEETSHISLNKTNEFVEVNGAFYPIYRGSTFAESQKVDALLDAKGGLSVSNYSVPSPFQEKEPEEQQHKLALDPKGNIVLENFGRDALVLRIGKDGNILPHDLQPYVVAHGYDLTTGEWSHGSYFSDLGRAYDAADPEIIEQGTIRWMREDIACALKNEGIRPTDRAINDLLYSVSNFRGWRDYAIQDGNEMIEDHARDYANEKQASKEIPTASLADRANGAKEVSDEIFESHESVERSADDREL